ncbi:MAG TPA: hypothetical protein VE010_07655 [Thermoanaerobaculia bacterium]|nr:hypothetical protein [Thermoanaerobaculia bacterium]
MRRFAVPLVVLLLAAACGSSTTADRPRGLAAPQIEVRPVGSMFFGSGSTAPITFEVTVGNPGTVALNLREVEITAPGMGTYQVRPVRRVFNEMIPAGDSRTVTLFTTAVTTVRDPNEPLNLRTFVTFESNGVRWRELVNR